MIVFRIGIIAFCLIFLQRYLYKKLWDKELSVSVSFSKKGMKEGTTGEVLEVIENRKRLPLPMLKVKFQTSRNLEFSDELGSKTTDQYYRNDVFQIGSMERITRKLSFVAKKRGYYCINGIDMVGSDLFFSAQMVKSSQEECYLYVYPKAFDSREFRLSLQQLNGEVLAKRHMLEDPFEYRGIREYQPYDDIRSVNWKATAKTGALKVNQKNYTALQTIRIYINMEDEGILKKEDAVEAGLQMAMGMSEYFLSQGIRVALYANGKDIITGKPLQISAGAGAGQGEQIGKGLARLSTEYLPFADLYEKNILEDAKGCMTIFIAPNAYEDYIKLLKECTKAGISYRWYCPVEEKEEPEISDLLQDKIKFIHIRDKKN